jgi:hypothetical protein
VLPDTKAHPKLLLRGWNVSEISIALWIRSAAIKSAKETTM